MTIGGLVEGSGWSAIGAAHLVRTSTLRPLYVKLELRAKNERTRDSAEISSSAMPSAKYSCSGSPLMFVNGSTAIEGLSGSGSGFGCEPHGAVAAEGVDFTAKARTGSSMFLTCCSPRSVYASGRAFRT